MSDTNSGSSRDRPNHSRKRSVDKSKWKGSMDVVKVEPESDSETLPSSPQTDDVKQETPFTFVEVKQEVEDTLWEPPAVKKELKDDDVSVEEPEVCLESMEERDSVLGDISSDDRWMSSSDDRSTANASANEFNIHGIESDGSSFGSDDSWIGSVEDICSDSTNSVDLFAHRKVRTYAYPDRLSNLAIDAFAHYVSDFFKKLVVKGEDYEQPCQSLHKLITTTVPPVLANELAVKVIRRLYSAYVESCNGQRENSDEVVPAVVGAVLHPSVMRLECIPEDPHITLLDFHKVINCELFSKSIPRLSHLKALGMRGFFSKLTADMSACFQNSLEEFASSAYCRDEDIKLLSESCSDSLKLLSITDSIYFTDKSIPFILRFNKLETLHVLHVDSMLFSQTALTQLLTGLSESVDGAPPRSLLLKSFSCYRPSDCDLKLLVKNFCNLSSLAFHRVFHGVELTVLSQLPYLKHLSMTKIKFSLAKSLLQKMGTRLESLTVSGISMKDLVFIGETCPSLTCFSIADCSIKGLPEFTCYWKLSQAHPLPEFPSVRCLHLDLIDGYVVEYLMSRYVNLRKLYITNCEDHFLYLKIIQKEHVRHLEEAFLHHNMVIEFSEHGPIIRRFLKDRSVTVHTIYVKK
ncbi:uncharacterized protein [Periplaneta americana]|uniref:uncharacterized protein isoform X2 n=2 Tax=Periplaneta americana TaxID=6978 RepID=UPI0037E96790